MIKDNKTKINLRKKSIIKESEVDVSVRRLLKGRFELGDFDTDEQVGWAQIPMSVVASEKHKQMALQMAREQMVLLKNNGVLPIKNQESLNHKLMVRESSCCKVWV